MKYIENMKHIYNAIQESLMDDEDEIFAAADSHILKSWFSEYVKGDYKYRILKNGNVKVTGDIVIKGFDGEVFPSNLHFDEVNGSIKIEKCPKLTNINGLFIEYAKVKGDYSISNCPKLTSLVGGPYVVQGNLYITGNSSLRSLDGMPEHIWDSIYIMKNGKKFTENTIKSYIPVAGLIVCSQEEDGELITEAMNEPHLLRLAQQLKKNTLNGKKQTFRDIFGPKFSPWGGRLNGDTLNVEVAFDEIDSTNVTEYRHASSVDAQKAIRSIISKAGARGLLLFTNTDGEYMFAITDSKKYRILSDKYAPGNYVAKDEWLELSYTDIMDRCDAPWGVIAIKWDSTEIGANHLFKKRGLRKGARVGMIENTPEQNEQFARANRDRYKRLAEQMRAQKDKDYIEIDEQVEKIVMDVLAISQEAKRNPEKYKVYDVRSLLEKTYGDRQYVGRSSIHRSGYAGENGLLKLYEQFTSSYMELSQNGGSSYYRDQYNNVKKELRAKIESMQKRIENLKKYR